MLLAARQRPLPRRCTMPATSPKSTASLTQLSSRPASRRLISSMSLIISRSARLFASISRRVSASFSSAGSLLRAQQLREGDDGRERRAQLMAHHGQELGFVAVLVAQAAVGLLQLGALPLEHGVRLRPAARCEPAPAPPGPAVYASQLVRHLVEGSVMSVFISRDDSAVRRARTSKIARLDALDARTVSCSAAV